MSSTWSRATDSDGASSASRMVFAIDTSLTLSYPSAGSARSTVAPWGSRTPGTCVTSMRTSYLILARSRRGAPARSGPASLAFGSFVVSVPGVEAASAHLLVGLHVAGARARDHLRRHVRHR